MSVFFSFANIIQGNMLAPILDKVVAKWQRLEALDFGMSFLGNGSTTFLYLKWIVVNLRIGF